MLSLVSSTWIFARQEPNLQSSLRRNKIMWFGRYLQERTIVLCLLICTLTASERFHLSTQQQLSCRWVLTLNVFYLSCIKLLCVIRSLRRKLFTWIYSTLSTAAAYYCSHLWTIRETSLICSRVYIYNEGSPIVDLFTDLCQHTSRRSNPPISDGNTCCSQLSPMKQSRSRYLQERWIKATTSSGHCGIRIPNRSLVILLSTWLPSLTTHFQLLRPIPIFIIFSHFLPSFNSSLHSRLSLDASQTLQLQRVVIEVNVVENGEWLRLHEWNYPVLSRWVDVHYVRL